MKRIIISALMVFAGFVAVSNAALVDFTELESVGDLTGITNIDTSNIVDDYILVSGGVGEAGGYTIVGENVSGLDASDEYIYGIKVTNLDDDTFTFSLVAYNGNMTVSDIAALATNESAVLQISVTGETGYSVGVKVSDNIDMFTARISDYTVVPEPVTMSTLALGALALIRKKRA